MVHGSVAMIRFLHTRIRVQDLDTSITFYQKLGYSEKERKTSPEGNQLAFLELPGNEVFLELTWSAGYKTTCPEDLMHTALGVEFKRNMVRIQPLRRHGDQNPERVRLDDLVHDVSAFDGKVIGDVHGVNSTLRNVTLRFSG